ncbi:hypothetical protein [Streptomyces sp. NPDC057238]|uniref:hypothetical protein n=1 Tax=Streptomyces sp. NPDC057238 TaxID=3346060 RepID=UPI003628C8D6
MPDAPLLGGDGGPFAVAAFTAPVVYLPAKGLLTEPTADGDHPTPHAFAAPT